MLYVTGGIYDLNTKNQQFKLVRPCGGLPYVVPESEMDTHYNLTKHHSHLYSVELFPAKIVLHLVRVNGFISNQVGAPQTIQLDPDLEAELRRAIQQM